MGFFTDAYDLFCISLVTKLLGRLYYTDPSSKDPGSLPAQRVCRRERRGPLRHACRAALLRVARRQAGAQERVRLHSHPHGALPSVASGLSFGHTPKGVIGTLCFFPVLARVRHRRRLSIISDDHVRVRQQEDPGRIHRRRVRDAGIRHPLRHHRRARRLRRVPGVAGARGGLPVAGRAHVRHCARCAHLLLAHEDARDGTVHGPHLARNTKQATADMAKVLKKDIQEDDEQVERQVVAGGDTWGLFSMQFLRRHGLHLLATTSTWFLLDIAFYSQNLFQKDIFSKVGWIPPARTMNAIEEVFRISRAQAFIALCGTIPGYWFTVALIDVIGRFWIQIMGFLMMTVFHDRPRGAIRALDAAGKPHRVRRALRTHVLLRKLRAKQHHVHRARGDLPRPAAVHVPRNLSRGGKGRSHHRSLRVPLRRDRHTQRAIPTRRNKLPRNAHVPIRPGVKGKVARGTVKGKRRRTRRLRSVVDSPSGAHWCCGRVHVRLVAFFPKPL
ncbi:hypothetical protein PR202_ga16240 [Eleusine coracana subsp. coracana]|uniref:Uncharacterized protein n=1 Tax=Eleusine coracana subsp. coracana TaxID=191504 RepID=A0AAV5CM79_ELECO|nr:hypothetical protein PR202_ga16240 [Eleusine coracana subsp. coracana]